MAKITREDALEYHRLKGKPGKLAIVPTKPMDTQRDLGLAYTPGVAEPVLAIETESRGCLRVHVKRQPCGSGFQRHGDFRPRRPRRFGEQACDGRQGCAVQEICGC